VNFTRNFFIAGFQRYLLIGGLIALLSACGSAPTQDGQAPARKLKPVDVPQVAQAEYQVVLKSIDVQNWPKATKVLQQMQTSYPQLLALKVSLGWVYWQSGNIDQSKKELKAAIATNKLYRPDAYNYLAIIHREKGEFSEAESLYAKALTIWPADSTLHINLGILYDLYLGQLGKALEHYRQAQRSRTNDRQLAGWIKDLERRTK
jgi:tetratricopeptide (TPR) repeat protein